VPHPVRTLAAVRSGTTPVNRPEIPGVTSGALDDFAGTPRPIGLTGPPEGVGLRSLLAGPVR